MYMPIWILYWFPFFLPINYIIKLLLINVGLIICKRILHKNNIYCVINTIKCMCFSIGTEIIGIAIFYVLEMNIHPYFYYENYTAFSLIAFFVVVIFNFLLNHIFIFRKINITTRQKLIVAALIAAITAPYLFMLPAGDVVHHLTIV